MYGCESWTIKKNWCFWTVVLEKTLESPLGCKEIQPVHPKGDQSWVFIGRTGVEAETPIFWSSDAKSWLIGKDPDAGKDWGQEEKETTEDEMVGWHHRLNGYGFGWTPGVGDGQGGLACCGSWGRKESDTTERLNWTALPFLSFIVPILAWNIPLISLIFLKRSLVFPILLFPLFLCIVHLKRLSYLYFLFSGTLHSVGYIFPFLLCLLLLFFSQLFIRPPQTTFLHFFFLEDDFSHHLMYNGMNLHAEFFRHSLPDLVPWISSSRPLYNHKGFDLGHTWMT